jgi:hypothetical protein
MGRLVREIHLKNRLRNPLRFIVYAIVQNDTKVPVQNSQLLSERLPHSDSESAEALGERIGMIQEHYQPGAEAIHTVWQCRSGCIKGLPHTHGECISGEVHDHNSLGMPAPILTVTI